MRALRMWGKQEELGIVCKWSWLRRLRRLSRRSVWSFQRSYVGQKKSVSSHINGGSWLTVIAFEDGREVMEIASGALAIDLEE